MMGARNCIFKLIVNGICLFDNCINCFEIHKETHTHTMISTIAAKRFKANQQAVQHNIIFKCIVL